jgi:hypothetical protein
MSSLFEQLSGMQTKRIPCALQPATEIADPKTGQQRLVLLPDSKPIQFEIQQVTPNQMIESYSILMEAKPPRLTHTEARAGSMGPITVQDGYDYDDPDYIAARQKLLPLRNSLLCIYGCPALRETTPGATPQEQAKTLMDGIGSLVVEWLSNRIENQTMIAGVGEEEVASFLAGKSGAAKSSGSSRQKCPAGRKSSASTGSTARRSATKKGKRPASGK